MKRLREFYVHWIGLVALLVGLWAYAIPTHVLPQLRVTHEWPALVWSLEHVTSRPALVAILWLADRLIRKTLWKLIHPELNFSGRWLGKTTYTHVRVGTTSQPVPFSTKQEVVIEQDCLELRLLPSAGKDFNFESCAIEIQGDGSRLVYAYQVQYSEGVPDRPREAYGYEWLDVLRGTNGKRPKKLKGKFAHCALGQEPVFSGEVELSRAGA